MSLYNFGGMHGSTDRNSFTIWFQSYGLFSVGQKNMLSLIVHEFPKSPIVLIFKYSKTR